MHQNEEWMREKIEEGYRQCEIAEQAGVSQATISRWVDRHGLSDLQNGFGGVNIDNDELKRLFVRERWTYDELADHFDCARTTISKRLSDMGIGESNRPARFRTDTNGYEVWREGERYVAHHRLLMVAVTGLTDLSDFHVHHINGVKWDNRPENIELIDPSSHMRMASEKGPEPPR
jgi:DNA-binding XRE family transcriptional regulator